MSDTSRGRCWRPLAPRGPRLHRRKAALAVLGALLLLSFAATTILRSEVTASPRAPATMALTGSSATPLPTVAVQGPSNSLWIYWETIDAQWARAAGSGQPPWLHQRRSEHRHWPVG